MHLASEDTSLGSWKELAAPSPGEVHQIFSFSASVLLGNVRQQPLQSVRRRDERHGTGRFEDGVGLWA